MTFLNPTRPGANPEAKPGEGSAAAKRQPADPLDRPVRHSFEEHLFRAAQADIRRSVRSLEDELELLERKWCMGGMSIGRVGAAGK